MSFIHTNFRVKILLFITALTFILSSRVSAQNFEWVKSAGGPTRTTAIFPGKIHVDATGNTYVTGTFHKQAKFDDVEFVTPTGNSYGDIFLAKYDPNGKLVWIKRDGGSGNEYALDIAVDALGSIYIMGYFSKVFNGNSCEIGGVKLESNGNEYEYFVAKYDSEGKFIWIKQSYNSGHNLNAAQGQIEVDYQGNVILQGVFRGETRIGNSYLQNDGKSYNLFMAKFNPDGNTIWATSQIANSGFDESEDYALGDNILGRALTVDKSGNIYCTGTFKGTLTFSGEEVASQKEDIFFVKIGHNGQQLWHKTIGSDNNDFATDIKIDSKGNPYLLFYSGQPIIDEVSNPKRWGTFVAKFYPDGNAYQINSIIESAFCTAMALDEEDKIYAIGHYSPTARVDCVVLQSTSEYNDAIFISQDKAGNLQWIKEVKGLYDIMTLDIKIDAAKNAYGLGSFKGNISFDNIQVQNIGGANTEEKGLFTDDMFIAKINNIDIYAPPSSLKISCSIPQSATINNSISFEATIENGNAPVAFTWDLGNGDIKSTKVPTLNYSYKSAGTYSVNIIATDNLGCQAVCSSSIIISEPISIPNIFTPNGDGMNDIFMINNYIQDSPFQIKIFNRWGKLVADLEDGARGWDGHGCSEGVYYYHIRIAGEEKKGWVELIR